MSCMSPNRENQTMLIFKIHRFFFFLKRLILYFIHLQGLGKTLEPLEGAKGKPFVAKAAKVLSAPKIRGERSACSFRVWQKVTPYEKIVHLHLPPKQKVE